jgi:hypothetical protein
VVAGRYDGSAIADKNVCKTNAITVFELLMLSHRSGRQPKTYVKQEAATTVFELLMMGGVSPETC